MRRAISPTSVGEGKVDLRRLFDRGDFIAVFEPGSEDGPDGRRCNRMGLGRKESGRRSDVLVRFVEVFGSGWKARHFSVAGSPSAKRLGTQGRRLFARLTQIREATAYLVNAC